MNPNNDSNLSLLNMADVLDINMADVEDVPSFEQPVAGVAILGCDSAKMEEYIPKGKTEADKQRRLKIQYHIESYVEVADAREPATPNGSLFTENFQVNEDGLKYFKRKAVDIIGPSAKDLKIGETIKELCTGTYAVRAVIKIKTSPNPNNPNQPYENVQVLVRERIEVVPA